MKFPRRQVLQLAAGAAMLPAVSSIARAQSYPTRPIRLIIGYTPGGSADLTARLMGQWLSERLGQSFVIENRPGGGTNVATEAALRAPPDGYTLFLVAPANAINATLYSKLNFNFLQEFEPIAGIIRFPNVVVVNPSVPVKSIPELIAYAKANPGKLNMASSGNGSTIHMSGELFKMLTGTEMLHVPYRGGAPALTDLISGQVQVMFDNLPTAPSTSRRASCAASQSPAPRGRTCCRTCPRWPISCPVTKPAPGTASPHRRTRLPKSSRR
jgi:tripartite-type tricarboxylate transporter receptor subunit TctC